MNRTSKAVSVAAALLCVAGTGCTDPTVAPKSTVTSANVFNDPNSYRAFLAKIYGGLIVTGQRGPDGNADIGGIDEGFGEYLRLYWYLQEMPTDEAGIGWDDPGLPTLNTGTWGASHERSEEQTSELPLQAKIGCPLLLGKKNKFRVAARIPHRRP